MLTPRALAFGLSVLLLPASAGAAEDADVGVVGGVTISSVRLDGVDATNITAGHQAGVYVGAFVMWPISPVVALRPEVAYSQRHFSVNDTLSSFSATEHWDWIDIPVLAHVRVWHADRRAVYVIGGPGFDFLVRAREDAGGTTSDVKSDVTSFNISIIGGAGVQFGKFGVEGRYDAGLKDLNKAYALGDALIVKNRTISVDVTWMFR